MTEHCPDAFDQALISGYLDHELRQEDEQLVRIHLEDCATCRTLHDELLQLREATMSTRFTEVPDDQWDECPRGGASMASRGLGWTMAIVWAVLTASFGLWQLWQEPQSLMVRVIIFGGISAFVLIFVSALVDRLRSAKNDPYREVQK